MVQPVLASNMWDKANEIMKDVYNQIVLISTIAAVVTASVALLLMNFSKSGKTVDESRAWLKRIIITWGDSERPWFYYGIHYPVLCRRHIQRISPERRKPHGNTGRNRGMDRRTGHEHLDLITTSVLGALGCSMDTFLRYFPAAETMYDVFLALALGLILLNWVWQLFKNYFMGAGIEAEDPLKLSIRSFIFIFLAFYAEDIVNLLLGIAGTPYDWILTEELPSLDFASFNSVITVILGVCANGAVAIIA